MCCSQDILSNYTCLFYTLMYLFADIFGGNLIGVRSTAGLSFYDWENTELTRRIDIQPKSVRKYNVILIVQLILTPLIQLQNVFVSYWTFIFHAIFTLLRFQVHWSDSGELCAIATDDTIYILKYNADKVAQAMENKDEITEDGVEEAFDVSIKIYIVHSPSISCDLAQQITGACLFTGCW